MELHFTRNNGPVDDLIDRLIRHAGEVSKVAFLKESDAVALFTGGFGTPDEAV